MPNKSSKKKKKNHHSACTVSFIIVLSNLFKMNAAFKMNHISYIHMATIYKTRPKLKTMAPF